MTSSTRREDEQEQPPEPTSLITSLPKDVMFDILTRLPRYEYSTLSLVSKQFRSLVTSPELYEIRSLIGVTEPFFYALFYDSQSRKSRWNIIHRKANGNLLLDRIPAMDFDGSFVAVGSRIYVFGGEEYQTRQRALRIDCRFHTVQHLPSMPVPMSNTIADIIDGRIYVIGDHYEESKKVMVVFNTETQSWELGTTKLNIEFGHTFLSYAVMDGKFYMRDYAGISCYEPKKCEWESKREDSLSFHNCRNASVIDNILYYYDYSWKKLLTYDPKQRYSGVVKGLEESLPKTRNLYYIGAVSYGGKLALVFPNEGWRKGYLWCGEISLEKREGGEIWGKLEWCDKVLVDDNLYLKNFLAVMV